jgi:replication-associated recombination protein RarA
MRRVVAHGEGNSVIVYGPPGCGKTLVCTPKSWSAMQYGHGWVVRTW